VFLSFSLDWFFTHQMKNYALLSFSNSTLCVPVSKLKWEGNLLLTLRVINFSASLQNDFVKLDKMQVSIQGVERDLRWIKQIDSRLYNDKDTQRVIQELGSKYSNEQQQLRKYFFFNWEALAKDAVVQNLIPDDSRESLLWCHKNICWWYLPLSLCFPHTLVFMKEKH